MLAQVHQIYNF